MNKMIHKLSDIVTIDGVEYPKPLSLKKQRDIAERLSRHGHEGIYRKNMGRNGARITYIDGHIIPIVEVLRERFDDPTYEIVGWLHDLIEDTTATRENLIEWGIGEEIVCIVEKLTRTDETYFEKIKSMKYQHIARQVKIADLENNMSDLKEGSMKDKYRFALDMLLGFNAYWEKQGKKK